MAEIKIGINAKDTIEGLQEGLSTYKKLMAFQIFRALSLIEKELKYQIRSKSGLHRRTGRLLNTWGETKEITETSNTVTGTMSSAGVPYAAIHEFGGIIKAVKANALMIPSELNQRADGSVKITPKEAFNRNDTFVAKGVLFQVIGPKKGAAKLQPLFFMRKEVKIPARPYVRPALAASKERILKDFGLFISAAFAPKKGS